MLTHVHALHATPKKNKQAKAPIHAKEKGKKQAAHDNANIF